MLIKNTFIRSFTGRRNFYAWKTVNHIILSSQAVKHYQCNKGSNLQKEVQQNNQCYRKISIHQYQVLNISEFQNDRNRMKKSQENTMDQQISPCIGGVQDERTQLLPQQKITTKTMILKENQRTNLQLRQGME